MSIKLIAVDMDGTFLNTEMSYNRPYFESLLKRMKEKNIHFICASGNQLPQLLNYFEGLESEITFIAENGAYVYDDGKELYLAVMKDSIVRRAIRALQAYGDGKVAFAICGKEKAYVLKETDEKYLNLFKKFYIELEKVDHFDEVTDEIVKFTSNFGVEDVSEMVTYLNDELGDVLTPLASGNGFIDLLLNDVDKGLGMKLLQERWAISAGESAAFGDSPNDIAMLQSVTHSYAMENATPSVKEVAAYEIGHNDTDSLLNTIEKIIESVAD
ncbi:5-amino-6-(5-phospho-D-ribitylamino)uracil phosphatase YbjI [Jeotgalibaca dankookensis]|uniref:5-amino-6-(5-phospho-D-ribitylamino)uracil phosphatase YbjI n=1 Tax=Jeotgalibaca dankookensis TaxID=708126 RepID=A0A1S6IQ53_9LACT|nr:Cof-type HAD-IIB family hydrolase [Jeotgalibaca dankookensis]AQS53685.1 5-amino-6-(5-phospho-D-ribitylamino)uracil phosphatase YbjI [Jeotgalibaca dankookensis]